MTEIEQLVERIAVAINSSMEQVPIDYRLWTVKQIANYMRRSEKVTGERMVYLPGFPKPIRLPTKDGSKGHPLWKAREVIEWVERHQERKAA